MTMADLAVVADLPVAPRSLHEFERLRALLKRPEQAPLFGQAAAGQSLLGSWRGQTQHGQVLRALLERLAADEGEGGCYLVNGMPGAGKTHLLLALGAMAQFPAARPSMAESWGMSDELGRVLGGLPTCLVVPVPLADHRGSSESLDEVLFAAAETAALASPFAVDVPLSADSYALRLLRERVVQVGEEELDAEARRRGYSSWEELREASHALAGAVARELAAEQALPATLTPSLSERLASLVQALPEGTPILWLVDDLGGFITGSGPKGAREDVAALDFVCQRAKIMPVYVVAAGQRPAGEAGSRAWEAALPAFSETYSLAAEDQRPLLRLCYREAEQSRGEAAEEAAARYEAAWPGKGPSAEEVEEAYPYDPLALAVLERAGARSLGQANFALRAVHQHGEDLADRASWRLVDLRTAARWLLAAVASAAPAEQIEEVFDHYAQRAAELWPQAPGHVSDVVGILLAGQLAGETLTAADVSRAMGLDQRGWARLAPREAVVLLDALVKAGPYVRRVAQDAGHAYLVVWRLAAHEQARREFDRLRAAIAPGDRRLAEAALATLAGAGSPLAEMVGGLTVELTWQRAPRFAYLEMAGAWPLDEGEVAEVCRRLVDIEAPETAALFIGLPFNRRRQVEAWRALAEHISGRPGAEGLALWLPRELAAGEIEELRTLVACQQAEDVGGSLGAAMADHAAQERLAVQSRALAGLLTAYREGQVLSLQGTDASGRSLAALGQGMTEVVSAALADAFGRRHPEFPRVAPRRGLPSREVLEEIYEKFLRPGAMAAPRGDSLAAWAEDVLGPLGLTARSNGTLELTARGSPVLRAVLDMLRARDTASPQEVGHAVGCGELAAVLFKSPFGLVPEMVELAVAALARLGYVIALDEDEQPLVVQDVPAPFAARAMYVARAPLLGPTDWDAVGRLLRAIGSQGIIAGDYEGQQRAFDTLVGARRRWLELIANIRRQLDDFWDALDQGPEQWRETLEDLDAAEQLFRLIDPSRPASLGLAEVSEAVRELVSRDSSFGALARFLSRLEGLERFFAETAPDLLGVYRYLIHPKLHAPAGSDVAQRRDQLLEFIAGGEDVVRDLMTFRRLQQVFFVTYARRYLSWHARAYQSEAYDRVALKLNSPEFRALERLARLQVKVEHDAAHVRKLVDQLVALRCTYAGLDRALRLSPVCPGCGLELGDEPDVAAPELVDEALRAGLGEYGRALSTPELREQLRKYMAALPRWGDLSTRLLEIANLSGTISPRQVLTLLTDEVITHLNRVLGGHIVVPRDLGELRRALQGKALTPEQAREVLMEWLEGPGRDQGEGGELLQFEE